MGRKRKISVANEEKENETNLGVNACGSDASVDNGPIYTIMSKVQLNETYHKKYLKELKQLYEKTDHDAFIYIFIKMIKSAMVAEETNEFAHTSLLFCAKFVGCFEGEETHPLLACTCRWLLTTISNNPHIRFRLCQFVNMILNALGQEATLDDVICDNIMEYMVGRLVDVAPNVRVQAILAMQRLQVPDNPDDPVLRSYQYHLCSDPSPRVRQAVITCMGRNYHTIPYILDRLWDIDEKVRRHTYLHMSSYPVRSYKVSQRLTLLEQGLNDRSDSVRKVVTTIMLQQWIESYQKDLVGLVSALKLDSNETELNRFRKTAKQALKEIFKRQNNEDIVACLPLETEGEFYRCVPYEKLNIETAFYWHCLTEYLQNEMAEELDMVIPELSVFCSYVEEYCSSCKREMDKFEAMEFQYILLSLMQLIYTFDLGDEIGRGNLQKLLENLLRNFNLDEKVVEVIVKCVENLITDQNARHQFFLDIISDICGLNAKQQDLVHDRNLISELLANSTDPILNLKLSSLKVKILDLEEQEMNYVQMKDYVRAQHIIEVKNAVTEEFTNLLRPLLDKRNGGSGDTVHPQFSRVVKHECILRSLQVTFYMVVSKCVKSLGHASCRLYNDFIFRNIASNQIAIRDWALKCGAAFSMLYEPLAKDVFGELYAQFFKNHNIRIWETAITCIFELLDRYGVDSFVVQEEQNKSKKAGRQLYNTLEFIDTEDDSGQSTTLGQGVGVIYMMSHFLDTCDDMCIVRAIINGFCRLVLHGHIDNRDIVEKLLLRYFNPITEPEINQILSVFLENLIQHRKQHLLQPCLMATVNSVLAAPYDSPLHDIRPETITHFIIDSTRPEALSGTGSEDTHNILATTFLNEMVNNPNNKELCKLLGKELLSLDVNVANNRELKTEMKELADKIIQNKFDPKTVKNVIDFKDILDGVFNPPQKLPEGEVVSDDEEIALNPETQNDETASDHQSNNDQTIVNTENDHSQNVSTNENTLTQSQASVIHTSASNITTTFGSANRTTHNLLRRKSNASRNNSIDCANTTAPDESRRSKIRIEARIDSDRKSKEPKEKPEAIGPRVRRSLRYAREEDSASRAREPEIIEMILISPSKAQQSTFYSKNAAQTSSSLVTASRTERVESDSPKNLEQASQDSEISPTPTTPHNAEGSSVTVSTTESGSVRRVGRAARKNNINEQKSDRNMPGVSEDESDTSDVIPASPADYSSITNTVRSLRSRTCRKVPHRNGKIIDSTPLRNGRKRVLRPSPNLHATATSAVLSSPVRKQPCIEIDLPQSVARGSCNPIPKSNTPSSVEKEYRGEDELSRNVNMPSLTVRPTSDDEKDIRKKSCSNRTLPVTKVTTPQNKSKDYVLKASVRVTRSAAKKEIMYTTIMTRKRQSQELLTVRSPALNAFVSKPSVLKSRIPVRRQQDKEVPCTPSSSMTINKSSNRPRWLAVKHSVGRSLRTNYSLAPSRLPLRYNRKHQREQK